MENQDTILDRISADNVMDDMLTLNQWYKNWDYAAWLAEGEYDHRTSDQELTDFGPVAQQVFEDSNTTITANAALRSMYLASYQYYLEKKESRRQDIIIKLEEEYQEAKKILNERERDELNHPLRSKLRNHKSIFQKKKKEELWDDEGLEEDRAFSVRLADDSLKGQRKKPHIVKKALVVLGLIAAVGTVKHFSSPKEQGSNQIEADVNTKQDPNLATVPQRAKDDIRKDWFLVYYNYGYAIFDDGKIKEKILPNQEQELLTAAIQAFYKGPTQEEQLTELNALFQELSGASDEIKDKVATARKQGIFARLIELSSSNLYSRYGEEQLGSPDMIPSPTENKAILNLSKGINPSGEKMTQADRSAIQLLNYYQDPEVVRILGDALPTYYKAGAEVGMNQYELDQKEAQVGKSR